ncbi:MAG: carbohydrate kinase family protein [Methylobacter sp.]
MSNNPIAIFGEALFDRFPDGQQILGGAPFNVAWHLQAFKQNPCFISRVGRDASGANIKQAMQEWGMRVEQVAEDPDYPTGAVQISLHNGEPSYEILADQAYDFIDPKQLDNVENYDVVYHGTLALRGNSALALQHLTERHRGKVFVDVNLREPWWSKGTVNQWLAGADWVKLNHEELAQLAPAQDTLQAAMQVFLDRYRLETLVVTCGEQGALALTQSGEFIEVKPESNLVVTDTVGAGDAFASVLLLGMRLNWPLQQTMARAQAFASAMVEQQGATVQDAGFYRPFIDAWHLD